MDNNLADEAAAAAAAAAVDEPLTEVRLPNTYLLTKAMH